MVRQYIGARYVPKFCGEWSSNNTYEPLSIVSVTGSSYTSKKSVPAGIDITNEEYWALTGSLNGQVVQLQNEIDAINGDIDDITGDIADANKRINAVSGKNVVFIGDSYNLSNELWTGWGSIFASAHSDFNVYNYAQGGCGFVTANENKRFIELLNVSAGYIDDHNSVSAVVVLGGYNDASMSQSSSDIQNAINAFIGRSKELYPNAKIMIGFVGANNLKTGMQKTCFTYRDYYKNSCKNNDAVYLDNIEYTLLDSAFILNVEGNANSGFHPNTDGNRELAENVYKAIIGQGVHVKYAVNNQDQFWISLEDGIVTINGFNPSILMSPVIQGVMTAGVWYDVLNMTGLGTRLAWGGIDTDQHYQGCVGMTCSTGTDLALVKYVLGNVKVMYNRGASFGVDNEYTFFHIPQIVGPAELFY